MTLRTSLSIGLCVGAFGVGIFTVHLAARNRFRSGELDATQRWCEVYARQNELLRSEIRREEWLLLSGEPAEDDRAPASPLPEATD
ncbi:MAG: hypothetical protein AB1726_06100 [Planctomycetota bacterium]